MKPFVFKALPFYLEHLSIGDVISLSYAESKGLVKKLTRSVGTEDAELMDAMSVHRQYPNISVDYTLKIEQYERVSGFIRDNINFIASLGSQLAHGHKQFDPSFLTAHLFVAGPNSQSFDYHTDPSDVVIWMLDGQKRYRFEDGNDVVISAGEALYIQKETLHRAENFTNSVMLSIGLEPPLLEYVHGLRKDS